jgi:hypothetical protein
MQDELDELVTSHRAELRKQWNLESDGGDKADKQELEKKEFEDAEDVLARLSEDLKKVGLEDKPGL